MANEQTLDSRSIWIASRKNLRALSNFLKGLQALDGALGTLDDLDSLIQKKRSIVANLEAQISSLGTRLSQNTSVLQQRDVQVQELAKVNAEIQAKQGVLDQLRDAETKRDAAIAVTELAERKLADITTQVDLLKQKIA